MACVLTTTDVLVQMAQALARYRSAENTPDQGMLDCSLAKVAQVFPAGMDIDKPCEAARIELYKRYGITRNR